MLASQATCEEPHLLPPVRRLHCSQYLSVSCLLCGLLRARAAIRLPYAHCYDNEWQLCIALCMPSSQSLGSRVLQTPHAVRVLVSCRAVVTSQLSRHVVDGSQQ